MKYRFDLVFSYWIFAWFIFHIVGWVRASPKLALLFGLTANTIMLLVTLYFQNSAYLFILINIAIKVVPLYMVRNEVIQWREDILRLAGLFAVFLFWNWGMGVNLSTKASRQWSLLKSGEIDPAFSPGISLLHAILR
jgi:hypothetical protein